jgi:hypothetical protein
MFVIFMKTLPRMMETKRSYGSIYEYIPEYMYDHMWRLS